MSEVKKVNSTVNSTINSTINSTTRATRSKILTTNLYGSSYEIDDDYDDPGEVNPEKDIVVKQLASVYHNLLSTIGEDPSRQGLKKTPERTAKALWYFTKGYRQKLEGKIIKFIGLVRDLVY